jgi:hypothetical protein
MPLKFLETDMRKKMFFPGEKKGYLIHIHTLHTRKYGISLESFNSGILIMEEGSKEGAREGRKVRKRKEKFKLQQETIPNPWILTMSVYIYISLNNTKDSF